MFMPCCCMLRAGGCELPIFCTFDSRSQLFLSCCCSLCLLFLSPNTLHNISETFQNLFLWVPPCRLLAHFTPECLPLFPHPHYLYCLSLVYLYPWVDWPDEELHVPDVYHTQQCTTAAMTGINLKVVKLQLCVALTT